MLNYLSPEFLRDALMLVTLMSYQVIHDFNLLSRKIHFQLEIFTEGYARKFVMPLDFTEGRFCLWRKIIWLSFFLFLKQYTLKGCNVSRNSIWAIYDQRNYIWIVKMIWIISEGFPGGTVVKNPPAMEETWVQSLGQEDPLEEDMATHSSILAWRIPWTEESSRLQSLHSQSGRQLSDRICMHKVYVTEAMSIASPDFPCKISYHFSLPKVIVKKQRMIFLY